MRGKILLKEAFNPLPCGTKASYSLTAVRPIPNTKDGDISRKKTILMMSLRLEWAASVR
jgi:hypothetical protein